MDDKKFWGLDLSMLGLPGRYVLPSIEEQGGTPRGLVTNTIWVNDVSESLDDQLAAFYADMEDNTSQIVAIVNNASASSLGGGSWAAIVSRASGQYGSIVAWKYAGRAGKGVIISTRSLFQDSWSEWKVITTDDTVLTTANWSDYITAGSAGGLSREFRYTSWEGTNYYEYEGVTARLYVVAVQDGAVADGGTYGSSPRLKTFSVDYYTLSVFGKVRCVIDEGANTSSSDLVIELAGGMVSFTSTKYPIVSVVGYY